MLAWCGYEATGFEVDNRRFLEAEMLRKVLAQIDERRTAHASSRSEFFLPLGSCPRAWCRRPMIGPPERPPRVRRWRAGQRPAR